ncbi:MAG: protein kinase [Verrucomicrobiota bacterium]
MSELPDSKVWPDCHCEEATIPADVDSSVDAYSGEGRTSEVEDETRPMEDFDPSKVRDRASLIDRKVGQYKLLESLGEGGMGDVFVAQQSRPVRRLVALKLIKPGMGSRDIIARFEAERQALALMDHPNIAKVLDAGTTEDDLPFFVMELVDGVSITKFCDQKSLSLKQRLELFLDVCQAIQHAHQKGIVHRDIKPSNVMVTLIDDKPVAKVIDFGVAKALGPGLTEQTLFTVAGQVVGTPQYMSPEQADFGSADVDTRSDIYSLGILLYELLSGQTPHDAKTLRNAGLDEILRIVREEEPPRPSTRVAKCLDETATEVAERRGLLASKLSQVLNGDLDWIVMKAIEKDRSRRYETANGFAADIGRYLRNEPVVAGPPSATYRLKKFAQRNKGLLLASGAVVTSLVAGVIVSTGQAIAAKKAERNAVVARQNAEELVGFMLGDLQNKLESVGKLELLADVGDSVESYFDKQGEELGSAQADRLKARMHARLARIKSQQGSALESLALSKEALRLYKELIADGMDDVDTVVEAADSVLDLIDNRWNTQSKKDAFRFLILLENQLANTLAPNGGISEDEIDAQIMRCELMLVRSRLDQSLADDTLEELVESAWRLSQSMLEDHPIVYQVRVCEAKCRLLAERHDIAGATGSVGNIVQVLDERPDDFRQRSELISFIGRSIGGNDTADPPTEEMCQLAVDLADSLVEHDPENRSWRLLQSDTYSTVAYYTYELGYLDRARKLSKRGLDILEGLLKERPDHPDYLSLLGATYRQELLFYPPKDIRAQKGAAKAVEIMDQLESTYPEVDFRRERMIMFMRGPGVFAESTGKPKLHFIEQSWELLQSCMEDDPDSGHLQGWRLFVQRALAQSYGEAGRHDEAKFHFSNLREWLEGNGSFGGLALVSEREMEYLLEAYGDENALQAAKDTAALFWALSLRTDRFTSQEARLQGAANAIQKIVRHRSNLSDSDLAYVLDMANSIIERLESLDPNNSTFVICLDRLALLFADLAEGSVEESGGEVWRTFENRSIDLCMQWVPKIESPDSQKRLFVRMLASFQAYTSRGNWRTGEDCAFLERWLADLESDHFRGLQIQEYPRLMGFISKQIGISNSIRSHPAKAVKYFENSAEIFKSIDSDEAGAEGVRLSVIDVLSLLERELRKARREDQSSKVLKELVSKRASFLRDFPGHDGNRINLARAYTADARTMLRRMEFEKALTSLHQGIAVLEALPEQQKLPLQCELLRLAGDASMKQENWSEAGDYFKRTNQLFEQLSSHRALSIAEELNREKSRFFFAQCEDGGEITSDKARIVSESVLEVLENIQRDGRLPAEWEPFLRTVRRTLVNP